MYLPSTDQTPTTYRPGSRPRYGSPTIVTDDLPIMYRQLPTTLPTAVQRFSVQCPWWASLCFVGLFQAAQLRREEKIRAEKEKIMNEDDSERQRRLEVRRIFMFYCFRAVHSCFTSVRCKRSRSLSGKIRSGVGLGRGKASEGKGAVPSDQTSSEAFFLAPVLLPFH